MHQSFLAENGIESFVKNNNAPYKEGWPELWVVDEEQAEKALILFQELDTALSVPVEAWDCLECGKRVDEGFGECWNCGTLKAS